MMTGGQIHGETTDAQVIAYAWYYTWPGPFTWGTIYSIALVGFVALVLFAVAIVSAVKYRRKVPFLHKLLRKSKLTKYMNLDDSREFVKTKEGTLDSKVI